MPVHIMRKPMMFTPMSEGRAMRMQPMMMNEEERMMSFAERTLMNVFSINFLFSDCYAGPRENRARTLEQFQV